VVRGGVRGGYQGGVGTMGLRLGPGPGLQVRVGNEGSGEARGKREVFGVLRTWACAVS
jgi:hypothetical protein